MTGAECCCSTNRLPSRSRQRGPGGIGDSRAAGSRHNAGDCHHNTHGARRLSERALVLLDGLVVEDGPTAGVFDAPRSAHAGVPVSAIWFARINAYGEVGPRALQACRYALVAAGVALLQACGSPTEPTPPPPTTGAGHHVSCRRFRCVSLQSARSCRLVGAYHLRGTVRWLRRARRHQAARLRPARPPSIAGPPMRHTAPSVRFKSRWRGSPELTATRFLAFGDSMTEGGQQLPPSMFIVPTEAYP